MNSVTVDPEMKKRIMNSVSAAIKEQGSSTGPARRSEVRRTPESARVTDIPREQTREQEEAPVRRKAKKTPVIVISSIAAVILILMGVLFVYRYIYMSAASKSTTDIQTHNEAITNLFNKSGAETTTAGFYAADTVAAGEESEAAYEDDDSSYKSDLNLDSERHFTSDVSLTLETTTAPSVDGSEGMGDVRIDAISKALPFELKGSGTGMFDENIIEEVFTGNGGEKVVLYSAQEGTDIYKAVTRSDVTILSEGTTPEGYAIKYCRLGFINVADPEEGETSAEVNAAIFTKNGSTYLIVFSDFQPEDVIGRVADAV